MNLKDLVIYILKLIAGSVAFAGGIVVGGILATGLALQAPAMPAGMDPAAAVRVMLLTSPLLVLALALLATGLSGSRPLRALVLAFFTWIAYTVNTQLEAAIFTSLAQGFWFTLVDFSVPAILCGTVVALLFPARDVGQAWLAVAREFWSRRTVGQWV